MTIRVFNHYLKLPVILVGLGEALVFLLSAAFAVWLSISHQEKVLEYLTSPRVLAFGAIMLLSMVAMGLYQARLRPGVLETLLRVLMSYVFGAGTLVCMMLAFPDMRVDVRFVIQSVGISFLGVCLTRYVFIRVASSRVLKRKILILGSGRKASLIEARFRRKSDWQSCEVVGFVHCVGDEHHVAPDKTLYLHDLPLSQYAYEQGVDEIVEAVDERRQGLPVRELIKCKNLGIQVINLQTFFEREAGFISLNLLEPGQIIFSDGFMQTSMKRLTKRTIDLSIASLMLLLSWPVMLLTALAIWLESGCRGPIFYLQTRIGESGGLFRIYKFRSMKTDAESNGAVWAKSNDDRLTKVGAVIRKYRIDELPQVFNVLKGDMSLVGPRPERPEFEEGLVEALPYYTQRHQVKPGITGWAQLCYPYGASLEDAREKLQFDLYYVKNQSSIFDVMIILQTVEVILFGKGAR